MDRSAAESEGDTEFTLDAALLARRKALSARRLHTLQIPAIRAAGFVILCVMALLQDVRSDPAFPSRSLALLIGANLSYAALAWIALRRAHGRTDPSRLAEVLFHTDVLMWLFSLHHLEGGQPFYAYLLLVRVADQLGAGFRRAVYFGHVVTFAYLAYTGWIAWFEPERLMLADRLAIAATMYLLGIYLSFPGAVIERLRRRTREAVRAGRALVETLGQKTRALQEQTTALEAQTRALEAQAVELEEQAEELDRARRTAEQASAAKSEFLALISHEIRTPMNGILGTAELLLASPLSPTQRRYAQTGHRSATALLALIDDLLDLSRLESGRLALHVTDFDLRALVGEAVDLMAVTARDKPITLHCSFGDDLPGRVDGDPLRLRQLLVNLLHNAVKFTERGSVSLDVAVLELARENVRLRFSISDTGIGIGADKLDSVWDAFTQADGSSTRRHGGSGLGLTIVKDLTDMMGGTLGVRSEPGQGSTFWIDLVLRLARHDSRPEPAARRASADAPLRVLLAEDDLVNQMVVQEMLKMLDCEVDVVGDGAAACAAAAATHYDLVFMDCHMPVVDGFAAARRIRAEAAWPGRRVPIVALTADALETDRQRCFDCGMDDFMTKPVTIALLGSVIRRWSGRNGTASSSS